MATINFVVNGTVQERNTVIAAILRFYPKPADFTGTDAAWAKRAVVREFIKPLVDSYLIEQARNAAEQNTRTNSLIPITEE